MKRETIRRADRVRLILDVRNGYKKLAALLHQYRGDSPSMRSAFRRATRELLVLNQALALVALESSLD